MSATGRVAGRLFDCNRRDATFVPIDGALSFAPPAIGAHVRLATRISLLVQAKGELGSPIPCARDGRRLRFARRGRLQPRNLVDAGLVTLLLPLVVGLAAPGASSSVCPHDFVPPRRSGLAKRG